MVGKIIACVVFVMLIGVSVLLLTGRGANLIAGFNTMSNDEKARYDTPALCRFVGKILLPIVIVVFIGVISGMTNASWSTAFVVIVSIASVPYIIVMAVYANTGNRFKK